MPEVLRVRGYRFFFFSREGMEPRHIHVQQTERYAKFWLEPIELAESRWQTVGAFQHRSNGIRDCCVLFPLNAPIGVSLVGESGFTGRTWMKTFPCEAFWQSDRTPNNKGCCEG